MLLRKLFEAHRAETTRIALGLTSRLCIDQLLRNSSTEMRSITGNGLVFSNHENLASFEEGF